MGDNNVRDVVLYSRVRLARNFEDLPFPSAMHGDEGARAQLRAQEAISKAPDGNQYALLRIHDLPDARRRSLVEDHRISRELLSAGEFAAVLLKRDETVSIMIGEDDHLRIHALLPGSNLKQAAALAFEADDAIGRHVKYAFDKEFGFLTSCPTNTGTGMRASALLHLPALNRANQTGQIIQELVKIGLTLRPLYSDEGQAQGELYLISNQVALGRSEQELLDSIEAVISEIIDRERTAREMLLMQGDSTLEDRLMRSLGILRYARSLSEQEWMRRWSDVRLAVQAGMLKLPLETLDSLLAAAGSAHLEMAAGRDLSQSEGDEARAKLVRETLMA